MTTPTRPFGALLTAMVTPMRADGEIDFAATQHLAKWLVEQGNDGLVLSGTTGEAPTTHAPEKVELIEAVREAVGPNVKIVAGAGSNDTAHAVRMAEQAAHAGADGVLALVPYYSKPQQAGIVAHIQAIASASDLPVMLYDIPGRTGIALSDASYDALADVTTIVANKDATGQVEAAKDRIERTGLAWYSGDDPLTLEFLRAGAVGVVSVISHVASPWLRAMIAAHDANDAGLADAWHEKLLPVVDAIMGRGPGGVMSKAALQAAGVIPSRATRLPYVPATDDEYVAIATFLRDAGLPTQE
jgi:4-hydroxy-tetrahydrodipicolinate synthase